DTVKALGLRLPLLWMFTPDRHAFHSHQLGPSIRHGFHALALDETRMAFAPVMWECPPGWEGNVEQVWFRGAHGDIGGQIGGFRPARPLANIPLVWMLDRAETLGLALPEGWRARFPCDPEAPMVGTWRSWGKAFLWRRQRTVGRDRSERLHPTAVRSAAGRWPKGLPAE
ncbi:MAG: phospholipase effector Tle1 domain-containing protein, partial [Bryobacteraceae bacterium]